jgi:hypothetical protein
MFSVLFGGAPYTIHCIPSESWGHRNMQELNTLVNYYDPSNVSNYRYLISKAGPVGHIYVIEVEYDQLAFIHPFIHSFIDSFTIINYYYYYDYYYIIHHFERPFSIFHLVYARLSCSKVNDDMLYHDSSILLLQSSLCT